MAEQPVTRRKDITALMQAISSYLAANGVGTEATDLFIMQMPETPTLATVIVPTGGVLLPEDPTRRVTFQIQHRSPRGTSGLPKAVEIHRLLDDQWNVLTGYPGRITAVSEAGAAFKDESGNLLFPLNFVFTSTSQD